MNETEIEYEYDYEYDENARLNLAGIMGESIVDGPGIRFAVFCQGCPHHCEGCHNPETHPFEGGTPVRVGKILEQIDKDPILRGVTFSGGEPMCQAEGFLQLAKGVKARGLDIVIFTGYKYEDITAYINDSEDKLEGYNKDIMKLVDRQAAAELMELVDILIDGRFKLDERDLTLRFRGSRNQRVIDMAATREKGEVILVSDD